MTPGAPAGSQTPGGVLWWACAGAVLSVLGGCEKPVEACRAEPTRQSCEKACEAGDAKSCHRLARILDELEHLDPELPKKAFDRSCELGSPAGCIGRRGYCASVESAADGELSEAEQACRRDYTQRACDLGDDLACRQIRLADEKAAKKKENK